MKRRAVPLTAVVSAVLVAVSALAGPKDPVSGAAYDGLVAAQDTVLQRQLSDVLAEIAGYTVAGPLDPGSSSGTKTDLLYRVPRVICSTRELAHRAVRTLQTAPASIQVSSSLKMESFGAAALPGVLLGFDWNGRDTAVLVTTYQTVRWLIWWRRVQRMPEAESWGEKLPTYASAVAVYLDAVDDGITSPVPSTSSTMRLRVVGEPPEPPRATGYGLPEVADLYPPRPDYVIEGYQNYKDYLRDHANIETWFADGILSFVPGDSLLEVLKSGAPNVAWPNKEAPLVQHEFRKYFQRGGNLYEINTLTNSRLAALAEGEYFYAVGLNGKIRFGFETPREEVERLEEETGRKIPRANHAFLFPGEPVLTAGAFFVERTPNARIVTVNTQSGHYFYSNVTKTVRHDIAVKSDRYLLTIGHFFNALDSAGITYDDVLISKM
jgi:hypothetical protein